LRCRLDVDGGQAQAATTCLRRFRQDFVGSPHDAEALALLAGLQQAHGGCAAALPLLDEYLKRYPTAAFATEAATRRRQCGR
jgi:TolA-binding protein